MIERSRTWSTLRPTYHSVVMDSMTQNDRPVEISLNSAISAIPMFRSSADYWTQGELNRNCARAAGSHCAIDRIRAASALENWSLAARRAGYCDKDMALHPKGPVRIVLVEHQPVVRRVFTAAMTRKLDCKFVTVTDASAELIPFALRLQPHVVLLDVRTPGLDGPATTTNILRRCPDAQVIMIGAPDDAERLLDHLCAGAQACIAKDADANELCDAIRIASLGQSYLSPGIARAILNEIRRVRRAKPKSRSEHDVDAEPLTDREKAILQLVVDGKTNGDIALSLDLAEGTVKNYVSRILAKQNVRNRTELAVKALSRDL